MSLSCAPGIIVWLFILRHDHSIGASLTTTLWAGYGLIGLTGVIGYVNMTPLLLTLHAATTAVTGAAMADTGPGALLSQCMQCEALGRDTCTSLLAFGGIASWGGLLMAALVAAAAALAHVVGGRILTQKQILAATVADCRAEVAAAYATLQETGSLGGHDAAALSEALAAVWAAHDAELRDEARAFVSEALARGLSQFADVLPPSPLPRSLNNSVMPEAAPTPAGGADVAVDLSGPSVLRDAADFSVSPPVSPPVALGSPAGRGAIGDIELEKSPVVGQVAAGSASGRHASRVGEPPLHAWGSGDGEPSDGDSDDDGSAGGGKSSKKEKKAKKDKKEKKDKKGKSRLGEEEEGDGLDDESGKKSKKDKKEKKEKKDKKSKHDTDDEGKKSKVKRSKSKK